MEKRGHLTSAFPVRPINQNHSERVTPLKKPKRAKMGSDPVPIHRLLCFIFIFTSLNKSFTVASHNLHSFKKSSFSINNACSSMAACGLLKSYGYRKIVCLNSMNSALNLLLVLAWKMPSQKGFCAAVLLAALASHGPRI